MNNELISCMSSNLAKRSSLYDLKKNMHKLSLTDGLSLECTVKQEMATHSSMHLACQNAIMANWPLADRTMEDTLDAMIMSIFGFESLLEVIDLNEEDGHDEDVYRIRSELEEMLSHDMDEDEKGDFERLKVVRGCKHFENLDCYKANGFRDGVFFPKDDIVHFLWHCTADGDIFDDMEITKTFRKVLEHDFYKVPGTTGVMHVLDAESCPFREFCNRVRSRKGFIILQNDMEKVAVVASHIKIFAMSQELDWAEKERRTLIISSDSMLSKIKHAIKQFVGDTYRIADRMDIDGKMVTNEMGTNRSDIVLSSYTKMDSETLSMENGKFYCVIVVEDGEDCIIEKYRETAEKIVCNLFLWITDSEHNSGFGRGLFENEIFSSVHRS